MGSSIDQPPDDRPRLTLPGIRDVRAVVVPVTIAIALAAFWWFTGRPTNEVEITRSESKPATITSMAPSAATQESASSGSAPTSNPNVVGPTRQAASIPAQPGEDQIVVDVRGNVRQRGILTLPKGSRVVDALNAAGGLRRGNGYGNVNLAAELTDGEQVRIGVRGPGAPSGSTGSSPTTSGGSGGIGGTGAGATVDINSASASELEQLPGVGPVLAERIVAHRETVGGFSSLEALLDVSGIGEKVLAGLQENATVG